MMMNVRASLISLWARLCAEPLYYIGGADPLPQPLSREEEEKLLRQLPEDTDGSVRAILIERNLRLVVFIARKFESSGVGLEDLISIGTIGLIKAVNTFDPEKKEQVGHLCQPMHRKRGAHAPAPHRPLPPGYQPG